MFSKIYKEMGLVLVCRSSATVAFTPSLLQNLVTGLFKTYSTFSSKLLWVSKSRKNEQVSFGFNYKKR